MTPVAPIPLQPIAFEEVVKPTIVDVPELRAPELVPAAEPLPTTFLQELSSIDRLRITKRLRVKNVLCLRGKQNRFFVRTPDNSLVYKVEEDNMWWVGYLCYGLRPLELKVSNSLGVEVMRIVRPYACTARVLPCQLQRLAVYAPPGNRIGVVEQQWSPVKPIYFVKNRDGELRFRIYGPYITVSCFTDIRFVIVTADGIRVGGTCKEWQGVTHALFLAPVTDKFEVSFNINLAEEEKALLLATTLLLDYMYYDS